MSNAGRNVLSCVGFLVAVITVQLLFVQNSAGSVLTCACNTQECRSQGSNRCIATNMCFVQYNPVSKFNRRKTEPVRGCINRSTPLLCENRPPTLLGDNQPAWPVLHCCSSQLCNRNIVPTSPPWLGPVVPVNRKNESKLLRTTTEESEIVPADPILSEADADQRVTENTASDNEPTDPIQNILSQQTSLLAVEKVSKVSEPVDADAFNANLLYIIIPAAAVFVLIILLIFAVLALRRRSEYLSTEDLVHKPSKNALRNSTKIYIQDDGFILPHDGQYYSFQSKHI